MLRYGASDGTVSVQRSVGGAIVEPHSPIVASRPYPSIPMLFPPGADYRLSIGLVVAGGVTKVRAMLSVCGFFLASDGSWKPGPRNVFDFIDTTTPRIVGPGATGISMASILGFPQVEVYRLEADSQGPTNAISHVGNGLVPVGSTGGWLFPVQLKDETTPPGDVVFTPIVISGVPITFVPPSVTIPASTGWAGFQMIPSAAGQARIGVTSDFVTVIPITAQAVGP